jgi:hypothetical protein
MTGRFVAITAMVALMVGSINAQEKKKAGGPPPDMEKGMAAMMQHATPGAAHEVFKSFVGKWKYVGKMWMDPSQKDPQMTMNGKAEYEQIMDGRFLVVHIQGDPPMPFEGRGCYGFDNNEKKYWYAWVDSMTTSLTTAKGTYDAKTKTFTFNSEGFDPMEGKVAKGKETLQLKSNDEIVHTFYKLDSGKEVRMMEITANRAK